MLFSLAEPSDQFLVEGNIGPFLLNYFNFGPVVQEISFEDISYLELWQPLFQRSKTIFAILVEGIMRNFSVKLF